MIVGRGSAQRLVYLVWRDEQLADFELRLQYRLPGKGNTGIEIRARPDPSGKRPFEGYHADLGHVGIGPHILGAWDFHFARRTEYPCPRGTRLTIDQQGRAHAGPIPDALSAADVRPHQWNHVRVVARGRTMPERAGSTAVRSGCKSTTRAWSSSSRTSGSSGWTIGRFGAGNRPAGAARSRSCPAHQSRRAACTPFLHAPPKGKSPT